MHHHIIAITFFKKKTKNKRTNESTGDLLPITYELPPVIDDVDEEPTHVSETVGSSNNKGKRKAQELEDEDLSKSASPSP